jgi:drug/metabolite transporter (DMT)-like permease
LQQTTAWRFDRSAWPAGMLAGIAAGVGAGAFWGMTFVAPKLLPEFSGVDVTVGRFVACGVFSLLLVLVHTLRSGRAALPTVAQAGAALWLAALGYWGYYLLLVWGIADAGPALPVLIIGTIPLWLMLLGKPEGLRWRALLPGLVLTALGMGLMVQSTAVADVSAAVQQAPHLWRGLAWAALAAATWTAFGLFNARWVQRHPEVNSALWANWLGVAAGLGALLLGLGWGTPWAELLVHPAWLRFVLVCAVTGIGSAWVAAVLWNMASRRLSPSLAGQLIVSETLFGLAYAFVWTGEWPALAQWLASALFLAGIVASIRAHRTPALAH